MRGGRLPSITVLLALVGALLLVPLGGMGIVQWQEANARYDSAAEVQPNAASLAIRLRLTTALSRESLSTGWNVGGAGLLAELPPNIVQLLGVDFAASLPSDRANVDALLDELGDPDLTTGIRTAREQADKGNQSIFEVAVPYDEIIVANRMALTAELATLSAAATAAGDGEVAHAARVAEAAASLQVTVVGEEMQWAQLSAVNYLQPSLADVTSFAGRVAIHQERAATLDRVVRPDSTTGQAWADVRDSSISGELLNEYEKTITAFALSGLPDNPEGATELDLSNIDLGEMLGLASNLTGVLDRAEEFTVGIEHVVEAALVELDKATTNAVDDASSDRDRTSAWLVISALMMLGAMAALVALVGQPVRRMADAADRLSKGQLDLRLSERGPKEIRIGARALNEALTSLEIAEAQAVALAEERLDDPVLEQAAPGELGKSLQAAVTRLANSLTERDGFQRMLAHEAAHDGLTKISNRNAILRHLDSAIARTKRSSTTLALLFIDIDDFKQINDLHGHHFGDKVLVQVAKRLATAIREGDLAGRLGGDEFVVVAEPVLDMDDAISLSRRIIDAVSAPITFEGLTINPSVSIGVGLADTTLSADELLRDADLAVYRAKSQGKGRVDVCDEDLRGEIRARTDLEQALRRAITNDEFVLHYQPTISTGLKRVEAFEALVRWKTPRGDLVYPDGFIPTAERSDLIVEIDRWVLGSAAAQLAEWSNDPSMADMAVAVNISGRHLGSGSLCADVLGALTSHGVESNRLIVEVTETALLDDLVNAARELAHLRDAGIRIALDDFGTGYMSLAHLRGLPVDVLKIDKSFVAAMDSSAEQSLIKLIVDTGHLLGVAVTAEGVETSSQAGSLSSMGIDTLQGYFYGRPAPASEAAEATRSFLAKSE